MKRYEIVVIADVDEDTMTSLVSEMTENLDPEGTSTIDVGLFDDDGHCIGQWVTE